MLAKAERKAGRVFDTTNLCKEWRRRLRRVRIGP